MCFSAASYTSEDALVTCIFREVFRHMTECLLEVLDPTTWPFVHIASNHSPADSSVKEQFCAEQRIAQAAGEGLIRKPAPVERIIGRHCVILRLFSRRRSRGDLQFYLDQAALPTGTTLHTVSVDIVVDRRLGDVTQPHVRQYWLRQQWTVGLFTAPGGIA